MATLLLQPGLIPSNIAPPRMPGGFSIPAWMPRTIRPVFWLGLDAFGYTLLGQSLNRARANLGMRPVRRFFRWWLSPDLVIGAFPPWYAPMQSDWPTQLRLGGFTRFEGVKVELATDVREFCKNGPSPIAFTLGTGMAHARDYFTHAVEACRSLNARGILLTKFHDVIPGNLPSTVRHCQFAPFRQLLPLCRAVVHHGGIGTTAAALEASCPQLVLPLAWDQPDNAARIAKLGVGLSLAAKHRSSSGIARSLARLSSVEFTQRCKEVALRASSDCGIEKAATWVEQLGESSSSRAFV